LHCSSVQGGFFFHPSEQKSLAGGPGSGKIHFASWLLKTLKAKTLELNSAWRRVKLKAAQLATLRFFALLFLLPGLAGLIVSAMVSVHYLEVLPRWPDLDDGCVIPRSIHGIVVYQTEEENRKLNLMEYGSVGVFIAGLGMSVLYLEKWGSAQEAFGEENTEMAERSF
jgi:hypothetical protein